MYEKRNYIRYPIRGDLIIKLEEDPAMVFNTELIDISFNGLSAYLKEKIAMGSIVHFEVKTELQQAPLTGKGKINYLKEVNRHNLSRFQVAIEFVDIDENAVLELLNYLQTIAAREKRKHLNDKPRSDIWNL